MTEIEALRARERIAVAAAAAMFAAGVILMTAILPAEYGVDPLGTGRLLGLTQMAQAGEGATAADGGAVSSSQMVLPGANTAQAARFRNDTKVFEIPAREGIEYKYKMEKGGALVYAWKATGPVKIEFHGEPEGAPKGYADFYHVAEGAAENGTFFAPTSGIHGWWWENTSNTPITLELTSAGFFTGATEFRSTGVTEHPITD
jgi:hypothetical protein